MNDEPAYHLIPAKLQKSPFVQISHPGDSNESLLVDRMRRIADVLGTPVALDRCRSTHPHRLTVTPREQARPNSLSSRFGRGAFPLHTDGANWPIPPRHLILGAATATDMSAPTVICHVPALRQDAVDRVSEGVFLVTHGANSFFGSICTTGQRFIRYDPACMKSIDGPSHSALTLYASLLASQPKHIIRWCTGDVLVVDNWCALHGRGLSIDPNDRRSLLRLYVEAP